MMDRPDDADERLDPWMEAEVAQAMTPADASIPLERMWTRVSQAPRLIETPAALPSMSVPLTPSSRRWLAPSLIAAGVLLGVAIGRFAWPTSSAPVTVASGASASAFASASASALPRPESTIVASERPAASDAKTGSMAPPFATSSARARTAPTRGRPSMTMTPVVAEHLQTTVAVLAAVRDAEHVADTDSSTRRELQQLLTTTRQLLDDPAARGARTHRLLQDLELVLAQLARARAAVPATRAAADEALRETNLLPRLKAATEMRSGSEER